MAAALDSALDPALGSASDPAPAVGVPERRSATLRESPANIAVWVLVWAELTEFALFFVILLVVRAHNPEAFAAGPGQLNTLAGILNTLILLTSSYCVARGLAAMQQGRKRRCIHWMWGTLAMGAAYLAVKGWEYQWNHDAGLDSRTNVFFTLYYYLTFNHLLHVLVGMCTIGWAMLRTHWGHFDAGEHEGLEGAACYWHMIDLVWIIIFPLLYVLR